MALTQLVINIRYALMSLSLSQKLSTATTRLNRFGIAFGITDEIFALAAIQPGEISSSYMYGLICLPFCGWTLGTLLGALAGSVIPAAVQSALGIAIYAMFIAIIIPPAKKARPVCFVVAAALILSSLFTWVPGLNRVSSGVRGHHLRRCRGGAGRAALSAYARPGRGSRRCLASRFAPIFLSWRA